MSYGDQSQTIGDLAFEKFTFPSIFGNNVNILDVVFGCGHDNSGTFNNYTSVIIGLGGGEVSIVNQLDKEINGKFSYYADLELSPSSTFAEVEEDLVSLTIVPAEEVAIFGNLEQVSLLNVLVLKDEVILEVGTCLGILENEIKRRMHELACRARSEVDGLHGATPGENGAPCKTRQGKNGAPEGARQPKVGALHDAL
uniref:Probable aspartic protease At2g35615 n=1 Tax=Nicotiana sylvestris TaxID=4096 RepID=A0A1U7YKY9_NICSY|nr:PREDICTED: probable aspartic protease At2g35615 [Nicotiana sylvestris]